MPSQPFQRDAHARTILKYGALIAPISLMFYGLMVQVGALTPASTAFTPPPLTVVVISLAWLLLGSMSFLVQQPRTWFLNMVELAGYYLLAAAQSLLITGIVSPLAAYWVLLLVATFVILGRRGLQLGVLCFIATLSVDTLVLSVNNSQWLLFAIMTAVAVLASSLVIVSVYALQQTSHEALAHSRQREALERERILTLINNLTDAVFSTDEHGIVKIYNAAALNLLDTNDVVQGRHISELLEVTTTDGADLNLFHELRRDDTIRKRDDIVMTLDGDDSVRLEATFAPVQNGNNASDGPEGYVLILRDITKMKSLEEERDEFISVVSHELRTPITITEGSISNAQLLIERGVNCHKTAEALSEAHKQVLFLAKMVNDLSTLSRAERGVADEAELIDVAELAQQLHTEYQPQAAEHQLALNLDIKGAPGTVFVSRLYLQELLQNFITNAIKYTPSGTVTLSISQRDNAVHFAVSDTGIGIGKSDLKKIFDRFYRAEDYRTRETNGTGLGLYVSAKLARKLGCSIEVKSRLNHGSTFSFWLPVAESDDLSKQ